MPLPFNRRQVEKELAEALPLAEQKGLWLYCESAARCLKALERHEEAQRWFLLGAQASADAAERGRYPMDFIRAANYCRLAGKPELGIPYLERAIPLLYERIARNPDHWTEYGAMAELLFLWGRHDEVEDWVQQYKHRVRVKRLTAPEYPALVVRARRERDPAPPQEVMTSAAEVIRKQRIKLWAAGSTISLHDWYEIAEALVAELTGQEGVNLH